jgi:hypothetical protein
MISNMDTNTDKQPSEDLAAAWGFSPEFGVCNKCGWGYLMPAGLTKQRCPHCFEAEISITELPPGAQEKGSPYQPSPELVLPFTLTEDKLSSSLSNFAQGIPYLPEDLVAGKLTERLQRLFIPVWLMDVSVKANWQGETGFNYEVVSHQEKYSEAQGGWKTRQVTETRVRWEPRRGRLVREYPNLAITAVEGEAQLKQSLADYRVAEAKPYTIGSARQTYVRLPDRNPDGAWQEVIPRLQTAAAEECRLAAKADHLRDFRWQPEYTQQNWTLLLLPLLTTYYLNDENQPQSVYINGRSGTAFGERCASPKRAKRTALIVLAAAGLIFLLSLLVALAGIALPAALPVGVIGLVIALLVALGAIIPPAIAYQFNRSQKL